MQCVERMKKVLDVLCEEKMAPAKKADLSELIAACRPKR